MYLPIDYGQNASEVSFIRFVDKKEVVEEEVRGTVDLRGINLDMDLVITPAAEVEIIFDEQAGDIVRGQGDGNINIIVTRLGDFKMFGDYEIDRGEYLFTLLNLINKPFSVKRGGSIVWDGDPFEAQIDLEASYADLKTSRCFEGVVTSDMSRLLKA